MLFPNKAFFILDKGAFKSAYDVMNNRGANYGAIGYGHIGADLITMCSMLRIPVCKFQKHYGNYAVEKNYDVVFLELT